MLINEIDLNEDGVVLPDGKVGIVIAQPWIELTEHEPFKILANKIDAQLEVIRRTIEIAKARHHGLDRTHFTVFPEYSIPGLRGIGLVQDLIGADDWPSMTVVIAGIDGLTSAEYAQLCESDGTYVHASNSSDQLRQDEWVNCSITFVKNAQGLVKKWVQPKTWGAWPECATRNEKMFCGKAVSVFKGALSNGVSYRFCTLVCFDWTATVDGFSPVEWILRDLNERAGDGMLPVTWTFVIQNNEKPSHQAFLTRVAPYFNQTTYPKVLRTNACIVFANVAGASSPKKLRKYGGASTVLSRSNVFMPSDSVPTVCKGGARFREGSELLVNYYDAFFRERGACIHSFSQINPASAVVGPEGKAYGVNTAHVFAINGVPEARAPNGPVPAAVKWINDELDEVTSIADTLGGPLAPIAKAASIENTKLLRGLAGKECEEFIQLATGHEPNKGADTWDSLELDGLNLICNTIDLLSCAGETIEKSNNTTHGTVTIGGAKTEIVALKGKTHEECLDRAAFIALDSRVLLVTTDPYHSVWKKEFGSYLDDDVPVGAEERITFPADLKRSLGLQNLISIYTKVVNKEDFAAELARQING